MLRLSIAHYYLLKHLIYLNINTFQTVSEGPSKGQEMSL